VPIVLLLISTVCYAADPPGSAGKPARIKFNVDAFEAALERIEARRLDFARLYRRAASSRERARLRRLARRYVERTIAETIFRAWMGTPWGLGRNSTSTRPHEPGMTVGCSYFVTSVLQNAGLRLDNRYRFAQAPALLIQRSLAPRHHVHRYGRLAPQKLERELRQLGDGLYLIGLNIHVGFVLVREGRVRVVHASYTPPRTVVDEPLTASQAIENSRARGYYVSSLFRDERLIRHWIEGRAVRFAF